MRGRAHQLLPVLQLEQVELDITQIALEVRHVISCRTSAAPLLTSNISVLLAGNYGKSLTVARRLVTGCSRRGRSLARRSPGTRLTEPASSVSPTPPSA